MDFFSLDTAGVEVEVESISLVGFSVVVWVLGLDITCRGEGEGLFSFQCMLSGPTDNVSFLTFELAVVVSASE